RERELPRAPVPREGRHYHQVLCRPGCCVSRRRRQTRYIGDWSSDVCSSDLQNRDAVLALERLISIPEHELVIANILEPIYKARGEGTKQIGIHEIMANH